MLVILATEHVGSIKLYGARGKTTCSNTRGLIVGLNLQLSHLKNVSSEASAYMDPESFVREGPKLFSYLVDKG